MPCDTNVVENCIIGKDMKLFDEDNSWNIIYKRLNNQTCEEHSIYFTNEARKPENRRRNRYRDVNPYDHSRVKLEEGENDYINASLVSVPDINTSYILTQGPLDNTIKDFWQMVWEKESMAILMLNKVIEKGVVKCSQYWPVSADDKVSFGEFDVSIKEECDFNYFILRTLELRNRKTKEQRDILHFHYTTWPDFGVPQSPLSFLDFHKAVRLSGSLQPTVGPPVVHCSAGIGRSGTFCLVDTCLSRISRSNDFQNMDIRRTLIDLRSYRMGLIQTPDQLRFSYLAIIEGIQQLNSPDSDLSQALQVTCSRSNNLIEHSEMADELDEDNKESLAEDNSQLIRKRNREERRSKTLDLIARMRERQRQAGIDSHWSLRYICRWSLSLGVTCSVIALGIIVYYVKARSL